MCVCVGGVLADISSFSGAKEHRTDPRPPIAVKKKFMLSKVTLRNSCKINKVYTAMLVH